ncbi:MAG TPA: hypothetical protein VFR18_02750 [Terriglobia bacterium]|nr:hypothetical protein [Terriglobia bacterium]
MLRLLERNIATVDRRLVLVAPPNAVVPDSFTRLTIDPERHRQLVAEMQRVRGGIYLDGGYVTPGQLSADGLHQTPEDEGSWHLLMTDDGGRVSSCAWYLEHENTTSLQHLRVRNCPLARSGEWHDRLFGAVASEVARARRAGLRYAEVGGWAVSRHRRCTSEGLVLALAAYGLCRMLGGALGITTANVTHASSSILRRLGGSYLEFQGTSIPAYFDPHYNTTIELLRFDSRRPSAKYAGLIELLRGKLAQVPVFSMPQTHRRPSPVAA